MIRKINFLILFFLLGFFFKTSSQGYSVRTNLFNLVAKGPSIAFGKYLKNNSEVIVTFSAGHFSPFLTTDYYRYLTTHIEYRKKSGNYLWGKFYYGGYLRFINKRIITNGFTTGPYGIFTKEDRNFIGNGLSIGLTTGTEWEINKNWVIDFNTFQGAGKYITQTDYSGHDKISIFLDTRIALQVGFKF